MATSRWEKERADWLEDTSRPGTSRRRRAQLLARRARRFSRGGMGTNASTRSADVIDPLWRRLLSTDEGPGEQLARLTLVPTGYFIVWLTVGPAIAVAAAFYAGMWALSARIGRLWTWPWITVGVLFAAAGVQTIRANGWVPITISSDFMVDIDWAGLGLAWLWTQLTLGLLFTGLYIRGAGWPAVPKNAVTKPVKNKKGEFIATPEHKKVRLDPLAGVGTETEPARHQPMKKVLLSESIAETTTVEPEDEPAFEDEEDESWVLEEIEAQQNEGGDQ